MGGFRHIVELSNGTAKIAPFVMPVVRERTASGGDHEVEVDRVRDSLIAGYDLRRGSEIVSERMMRG